MRNLVVLLMCLGVFPVYAQKTTTAPIPKVAPNKGSAEKSSNNYGMGSKTKNVVVTPPKAPITPSKSTLPPPAEAAQSPGGAATADSLIGKVLWGNVSKAPLTANEVRAMPQACITIGMGRIDGVFWVEAMKKNKTEYLLDLPENAMAKDAGWFHHYCWGSLSKLRSIYAKDEIRKASEIRIWRANMEFIVEWIDKQKITWAYMPDVFSELAETYFVEKNYAQAVAMASKSLELSPKHMPAYAVMVDSYQAIDNKEKALAAATEALKYAPDSKGMKRRYKTLGGTEPYPEPYVQAPPAAAQTAPPTDQPGQVDAVPAAATAPAVPVMPPPASEPIGNATNPYCRFCP